jgi:hypothetical protein
MKKLTLTFLFLLLCSNYILFAQAKADNTNRNIALLYRMQGLGNFGIGSFLTEEPSFQITDVTKITYLLNGIGFKYYLTNDISFIPSLLFGYNSENEKADRRVYTDEELNFTGLGIYLGFLNDVVKSSSFLGYIGFLTYYLHASHSYKPSAPNNPPLGTFLERNQTTNNFSLGANIGFEYFIFDRVSLVVD